MKGSGYTARSVLLTESEERKYKGLCDLKKTLLTN